MFAIAEINTVQQNKTDFSAFSPQESIRGVGSYSNLFFWAALQDLPCVTFRFSPLLCLSFLDPQTHNRAVLRKAVCVHTCHFPWVETSASFWDANQYGCNFWIIWKRLTISYKGLLSLAFIFQHTRIFSFLYWWQAAISHGFGLFFHFLLTDTVINPNSSPEHLSWGRLGRALCFSDFLGIRFQKTRDNTLQQVLYPDFFLKRQLGSINPTLPPNHHRSRSPKCKVIFPEILCLQEQRVYQEDIGAYLLTTGPSHTYTSHEMSSV